MIIIAGYTVVAAGERDRVVSTFADLVTRVRAADGCLDAAITADPIDAGRIYNLEVWRDADALDAWRARANAPDPGVEILEEHVARYDATDGGPLFPCFRPSGEP